ncbi:MAG: hypothetical protein RSE00_05505 [Clostridia bacterium]
MKSKAAMEEVTMEELSERIATIQAILAKLQKRYSKSISNKNEEKFLEEIRLIQIELNKLKEEKANRKCFIMTQRSYDELCEEVVTLEERLATVKTKANNFECGPYHSDDPSACGTLSTDKLTVLAVEIGPLIARITELKDAIHNAHIIDIIDSQKDQEIVRTGCSVLTKETSFDGIEFVSYNIETNIITDKNSKAYKPFFAMIDGKEVGFKGFIISLKDKVSFVLDEKEIPKGTDFSIIEILNISSCKENIEEVSKKGYTYIRYTPMGLLFR